MTATEPIIYEEMVQEFQGSLLTQLRGHGLAIDYLETWVPDADPVKSILNMVEAAEAAGKDAFSLQVSAATLDPAARQRLAGMVAGLGAFTTEAAGTELLLHFTGIGAQA
jgi:hypothetical protein